MATAPKLTEPPFVQVPGSVRSRKRRSNECFEHLVHVRMLLLLELLHEQGILLKQLPEVLCGRHDWKVQVEPRSATMKEVFMRRANLSQNQICHTNCAWPLLTEKQNITSALYVTQRLSEDAEARGLTVTSAHPLSGALVGLSPTTRVIAGSVGASLPARPAVGFNLKCCLYGSLSS